MPAAAVIPTPMAYIKVVAIKKLVVGSRQVGGGGRFLVGVWRFRRVLALHKGEAAGIGGALWGGGDIGTFRPGHFVCKWDNSSAGHFFGTVRPGHYVRTIAYFVMIRTEHIIFFWRTFFIANLKPLKLTF